MPARGLQDIPFGRIPERWDRQWFIEFIRDVLAKLDVRNAIEGPGIQLDGTPNEPATISSSEDLMDLLEQSYILAVTSSFLANERVLAGESGVVSTTDGGPGNNFTVGIVPNGISNAKLRVSAALSVIGRPENTAASPQDIIASAPDTVLRCTTGTFGDELTFGELTVDMAPDALWTYAKIQDATALSVLGRSANTNGVLDEIVAANDGEVLRRSGTAVGFGSTLPATLTWDDDAEVRLGTGGDLRLYHDGTDSWIDNDTGTLIIDSADERIDVLPAALDTTINLNIGLEAVTGALATSGGLKVSRWISVIRYGSTTLGPTITLASVPGTVASPTPTLSGDGIGAITFAGNRDTSPLVAAQAFIRGIATENWSGSVNGTKITFSATPNGSIATAEVISLQDAPTTGAQTATFTATNKPGTGTAGPTAWLPVLHGATTYYIPLFGA